MCILILKPQIMSITVMKTNEAETLDLQEAVATLQPLLVKQVQEVLSQYSWVEDLDSRAWAQIQSDVLKASSNTSIES